MDFIHIVLWILKSLWIVLSENHQYFEQIAQKNKIFGMPLKNLP